MIDLARRIITIDGVAVRPTRLAFDLCAYLGRHPGMVRTRVQIMDAIGIEPECSDLAVDSLVKRVRQSGVKNIRTSYGVGYYWGEA